MSTTKGAIGAGRWSIETVRNIVRHHQHAQVAGVRCDAFTASAVVAVYDALKPETQAKMLSLPFIRAVSVAWKFAAPESAP